jgi:hypothetical protein
MALTVRELRTIAPSTGMDVGRLVQDGGPRPEPAAGQSDILWRVVLVGMGFGIAVTGWMLIMSVLLSFLGLPLFMFGLALMQSQER